MLPLQRLPEIRKFSQDEKIIAKRETIPYHINDQAMNDLLSIHLDPVEEAKHLASQGKTANALTILTPLIKDIISGGGKPSNELQALLESLTLSDAIKYGTT